MMSWASRRISYLSDRIIRLTAQLLARSCADVTSSLPLLDVSPEGDGLRNSTFEVDTGCPYSMTRKGCENSVAAMEP
jgi:hypothetical protein